MHELNVDKRLYAPLKALVDESGIFASLDEEEQRVALALLAEFERDGIGLSQEEKRRVFELQMKEQQLHAQLASKLPLRKVPHVDIPREEVERYPPTIRKLLTALAHRIEDNGLYVRASDEATRTVLTQAPCPVLRQRFFLANHCADSFKELNETLEELIKVRHALAQGFGYESYAHLVTSYKMARTPENVLAFLRQRNAALREELEAERKLLIAEKASIEGGDCDELYPWDLAYLRNLASTTMFGDLLEGAPSYLSTENCIRAFQLLCSQLFGVEMREAGLEKEERWAGDIRKLLLWEDEKLIGTLYLDLFAREGKYANPCHMQIHTRGPDEQLVPTAAVICNLPSSIGGSRFSLLAPEQVSMLFHEFGHALHCLLSNTKLQFLAGTRGEQDFVETPAQLMEYFAFDPSVLELYAKHYITGARMSKQMTKALNQSSSQFQASTLQQQLFFSAIDQTIFGPAYNHDQPVNSPANEALLAPLYDEFNLTPLQAGTAVITRFSHLVTYGAVYYSYAFGSAFAADIWTSVFKHDPLSRAAGTRYRESILRWGGTRDPSRMLADALRP